MLSYFSEILQISSVSRKMKLMYLHDFLRISFTIKVFLFFDMLCTYPMKHRSLLLCNLWLRTLFSNFKWRTRWSVWFWVAWRIVPRLKMIIFVIGESSLSKFLLVGKSVGFRLSADLLSKLVNHLLRLKKIFLQLKL